MIRYENLKKVNEAAVPNFKKVFNSFWNSGSYILGKNLKKFEYNFASFLNSKYAVGVNSGYDALFLSLKCLNLPRNSEVIMSSCSYIAALNAVLANNLKPILVEPNISTYTIDPNKIEEIITKKSRAILITHLYGRSCQMDKIINIKKKYKLFLIEDCAQSHGSRFKNKSTGTFGDFGCFSFYPTKNLGGLGDGGIITTNQKKFFKNLNYLRNYGFKKKNFTEIIGFNSRLDDFQAAFLNKKLKKLNLMNRHKIKLAKIYDKYLTDKVVKPLPSKNGENVYHIYPVRYKNRKSLMNYLKKNKIEVSCHYPVAPHKQKSLKKIINKSFVISEEIHKSVISLPISFSHSEKDIRFVCKMINKFI